MTHVLLIHFSFKLPNQPGGTRHYELARHLAQEGHHFTAIASNLHYGSGKPVDDGQDLMVQEGEGRIRLLRAYTHPSMHGSLLWRMFAYVTFTCASLWPGLRVGPIDLIMGTSPPIFQCVPAWLLAAIHRRPFLLEIRDLWPEFAIDLGVLKNPLLITIFRWLEQFLYARATHILVNSPAYSEYLIDRGIPAAKISLIPNGVDPDMFHPEARGECIRQEWSLEEKFLITYAGHLGLANDIPTILRAAARLRDRTEIHFLLVGDGAERQRLESMCQDLQLQNVTFGGLYPKSRMSEVLAASNACVATLKDIPMFRTTYPNKIFDYMAAGRPTILAIDGVIRQVVEAAEGGVFVPPGDDEALAEAAYSLSQDRGRTEVMGRAARAYVVQHFNRHQHAAEFVELVQRLTKEEKK